MANKYITNLLVFIFLLSECSFAQYTKYWIQFTDKNGTPYTLSNPSQFLSQRAMDRRARQGIAYQDNDLPINPAYIAVVAKMPGVKVINHSKWFNAITIYAADTNAVNKIKQLSFVSGAKGVQRYRRNASMEAKITAVPVYPLKLEPSGKNFYNYGPSFNQINMIDGVCLHNQGFHGEGIQIAILDAGFYKVDSLPVFDSLKTNKQILGTRDFVDGDTSVYDASGHGALVLSTMGGNIPGLIVGTAPKAKYWLLRTEQEASEYIIEEDNWVSGAEFADSVGADIISTSLGYTTFDSLTADSIKIINPDNHSYADMNGSTCRISIGADMAASKGLFVVCSAGNSGASAWNFIGAPADAHRVLAVGAVDSIKKYASFSSNGPTYDGRVKPNVAAQGQDAVLANLSAGGIMLGNGTSFSCPITAGMVACLWQAHPGSTNLQVFNAILETASQYNSPDTLLGYGISDFCAANTLLSIIENPAKKNPVLNLYPNPFHESTTLVIQGINSHGLYLSIFDIVGNLVHKEKIKSQSVNLTLKLAKGIYTLQVKDGSNIYSAKLIKD